MADPILIRCPSCQHKVAIPADFAGKVVTCMECHAAFHAPDAENKDTPPRVVRGGYRKYPPFLFVPMFGLLLLGGAGLFVNTYLHFLMRVDPAAAKNYSKWLILQQAKETPDDLAAGKKPGGKQPTEQEKAEAERKQKAFEDDQIERAEKSAEMVAPYAAAMQWPFALVSLGVLAGGIAFAVGRYYWLAILGCVLAMANINHACCIPGAVVGIWGFLALISDDGRRHFGRKTPDPGAPRPFV